MKRRYLAAVALVASGCASRGPGAWRFTGQVLTPPHVARSDAAAAVFSAKRTAARDGCPNEDAVRYRRRGSGLRITVDRAALEKKSRAWLADWTGQCFAPAEGAAIAERVLDAVPLNTAARYRLMRASDLHAGYIDLGPYNRLELIRSIGRDATKLEITSVTGTDRSLDVGLSGSSEVLGHEILWYDIEPRPGGGARVVALTPAAGEYLPFRKDMGFYRLFLKTDQNDVVAIVAGAATHNRLPGDPDGCGKGEGVECITLPKRLGVNPHMAVTVNGKPLVLPPGATVRNAIQASRVRVEAVMPTLSITKLFEGRATAVKFDRSSQDILAMTLVGDEVIRW